MAGAPTGTPEPAPTSAPWPSLPYASYVLGVLMLAYAFAILDRIAIGLMVDPIKHDLGISDTQIGLLQGLAFSIFYTAFGLPMGFLVDRWKRGRMLAAAILFWSAAAMSCGLARSFGQLFMGRVAVGAGEAVLMPASTSLISDYFAPQHRARAMGVFMIGGAAGSAMAYFLSGFAIDMAAAIRDLGIPGLQAMRDWQIAFMVIGAPGLVVSLLMLLTVREPPRRERAVNQGSQSFAAVIAHMRTHALAYVAVMMGGLLTGVMVAAQTAWFPSLFIRVYDWSPSRFGTIFGMISFPCGVFSALSAGWLLTYLAKTGRDDGPILVILGQTVVWGIFGTAKALAPNPALSMAFHIITNFCGIWSITAAMTALSQITPNEMRGKVVAI